MKESKRREFLNIPNYITLGRLLAVPILVVIMLFTNKEGGVEVFSPAYSIAATIVFLLAAISDLFDGYFARKYNMTSTFGKFFDPLADKLLVIAAMIMMIPMGRIPAWLVVIFFSREVVITALRGIAVDSHIVIAASEWGKYKSAFVNIVCVGLLLHYPFFGVQWRLIAWVIMIPAVLFTIGSGIHYTAGFIKAIIDEPPDEAVPL